MNMHPSSFEAVREKYKEVRSGLLSNWDSFSKIEKKKQLREVESDVMRADLWAESTLVPALHALWSDFPFLCEEAENSGIDTLVPTIKLLPYTDDVTYLPDSLVSVDGVDGSALYENQYYELVAILAGRIENKKPVAGLVMTLDNPELYHTGVNGMPGVFCGDVPHSEWQVPMRALNQSLIITDDNKAVDDTFRTLVINKLTGSRGTRYPLNCPSGVGALNVLRGRAAAFITNNARLWDLAATAALVEAAGMVVRRLDGAPVPWNQVRMPAVVFARDEETFQYVQETCREYLETKAI